MAVRDFPIDFGDETRNRQVVYSPHDYGPLVYEQPWFTGGFTAESLYNDAWHDYWLYIAEEDIAPILIGEWGGFMSGDNLKWMQYLRDLIGKENLNHTFWCFNANSGDTGGLVKDDFITWDEDKYALVETVLWKNDAGKFIGLDHEVPLGANGISLTEHSGNAPTPVLNGDSVVTVSDTTEADDTGSVQTVSETGDSTVAPASAPQTQDPNAQAPAAENKNTSVNSGMLVTLLVISVILLVVIIILNVRKYNKKKLDNEFEERMRSEDEALKDKSEDSH